jgi:hypothetical protein
LRLQLALLLVGSVEAICVINAEAQVQRHTLWTVDLPRVNKLRASVGDMILVRSATYPLIPSNLNNTFDVAYDHSRVRLIAETPGGPDGRVGRQFYFVLVAPGFTRITVTTRDREDVVRSSSLEVTSQ